MLPSQTARSASSRSHMYRRGKQRPWILLGVVVLAVVGTVMLIRWWSGRGEPASADAGTPNMQADSGQTSPEPVEPAKPRVEPVQAPVKATPPPQNDPPKFTMGGSRAPAGASNTNRPGNPTAPALQGANASPTPPRSDVGTNSTPRSTPNVSPPAKAPDANAAPASQRVQIGLDLLKQNKPVEARKVLSEALVSGGLSAADADRVRTELTKVNERLVFSPEVVADDPFVSQQIIASGESLAKLPRKLGLNVDWRFLQRVNQLSDPTRIRVGQRLKVVKGPFHAIVDKRTFRLDLYMGDFSDRVFVRSFTVGLGEYGATPEGAFVVKPDSKLVNPAWTNPRTGEQFDANDPKNPLGEYWIGLVGDSDNIRGLESYGIHGTVDPDSVGKERSMGCVRLLADDIKLLYEVLIDNVSRVEIRGNDWP